MLTFDPPLNPEITDFLAACAQEGFLDPPPEKEIAVDQRLREWCGFSRFCAEHLRIVDMHGDLVPLDLNWMQRRILSEEIRARRAGRPPWFIVLKYRKGGVTTLEQALGYWTIWRQRHQRCLTLAHRPGDTRLIFHMVELYWRYQPEEARHPKSPARTNWIELPDWDGIYMSGTAGAEGISRGMTLQRVHLSEAAQYRDLREIHQSVTDSLASDGSYVIESTAFGCEGRGEAFHEFWKAAKRGESAFTPLFFAWHHDVTKRIALIEPDELEPLSDDEERLRRQFNLSLEQLKWWRAKRRQLLADGGSADVIHQEHPSEDETAFLYGTEGYYDRALLLECEARCVDPIRVEDDGRLRIFEEAQPRTPYCMGVDVAEGIGGDDSAVVGFNARTGKQAFSWNWNRVPPDDLGRLILGDRHNGFGYRWKNESTGAPAFIMVERNNHGHACLTGLLKMAGYPHDAVYHHYDPTKDDPEERASALAGWPHSSVSHVHLQSEVGRMLREKEPHILDRLVISSIRHVAAGTNGANFKGRDLAVAAGLGSLAMPHIVDKPVYAYIGGRLVEL